MLRVKTYKILHIGDDYDADYIGAKNAGLKAILLDRAEKHRGKEALR